VSWFHDGVEYGGRNIGGNADVSARHLARFSPWAGFRMAQVLLFGLVESVL
jgi:hypothetical protein